MKLSLFQLKLNIKNPKIRQFKIFFLGDSITAGAGASKIENNYVNKVGEKLGVESLNFGVGGTRIAKQNGDGKDGAYTFA